ncbi:flagellar hook-length control protein FliK [Glaciimonas sp. GNP009]
MSLALAAIAVTQSNFVSDSSSIKNIDQNAAHSFGKEFDQSLEKSRSASKDTDPSAEKTSDQPLKKHLELTSLDQTTSPDQTPSLGLALMEISEKPAVTAKGVTTDVPSNPLNTLPSAADTQLRDAMATTNNSNRHHSHATTKEFSTDNDQVSDQTHYGTAAESALSKNNVSIDQRLFGQSTEHRQAALNDSKTANTEDKIASPAEKTHAQNILANGTGFQQQFDKGNDQSRKDEQSSAKHALATATSKTIAGDLAANTSPILDQFNIAGSAAMIPVVHSSPLSPNMNNLDTNLTNPVQLHLGPSVASGDWGTALGKQVVWMGNNNQPVAELHLNPPDLGPLKVTLTFNDNQAQAQFISAHQSVRAAIEAALPQLRSSLAENGINLSNTSVSADAQQQQQQQQSAFTQHDGKQSGQRNHGSTESGLLAQSKTNQNVTVQPLRPQSSRGVDTFV